jgi:DNA-binding GntR family transcriptional regulator
MQMMQKVVYALGMPIRRDDPRPPFEQLADELRQAIERGAYRAGDQLPSQRQLAVDYGIAPNTVRRALEELADEGLVVAQHGAGHFVSQPPSQEQAPDTRSVEDRLADAERRLDETARALAEANSRLDALTAIPSADPGIEPAFEPGPEPASGIGL